ncbi:hypothetical protein SAMN06265349_1011134 [Flavobacterium resistens]|uniref:Uncharacterized protein n=1 Tax=Flavobacterium resistens TaxID=443612 RepID=A0A521BJV3_9FLAO|nr:hypothetical protein [Flavobacterium resistens]MRX67446.1 hypothetical protein [Flavobacterium resistens]SMO47448.1 hypothetical protein SAMN06265349_1011134 [Flavobacterium resistens]
MKKALLLIFTFLMSYSYGQENKIEMISKLDMPPMGSREFILEAFQGIEKIDLTFTNSEKLIGKNYKIVIRKYKNGKVEIEKVAKDTKKNEDPKIGKDFKFSIVAQQLLSNEKITFAFSNSHNKNIFDVNKKYKDNTFSLREISDQKPIEIQIGKEFQIAFITPPNDNEEKGALGYCEVTKGYIDIEKWYKQYEIDEFFLIFLTIED